MRDNLSAAIGVAKTVVGRAGRYAVIGRAIARTVKILGRLGGALVDGLFKKILSLRLDKIHVLARIFIGAAGRLAGLLGGKALVGAHLAFLRWGRHHFVRRLHHGRAGG